MKAVLFTLALIAAPQAMASHNRDCTPYIQPTYGESGETEYYYPCGSDHTVTHRVCKEGEVAYTSEPNGEGYTNVPVVCHNGSFAPPAPRVIHRGCKEGEISYTSIQMGEGYVDSPIVCRNGRFVPLNK